MHSHGQQTPNCYDVRVGRWLGTATTHLSKRTLQIDTSQFVPGHCSDSAIRATRRRAHFRSEPGDDVLMTNAGEVWGWTDTTPYMEATYALADLYWQAAYQCESERRVGEGTVSSVGAFAAREHGRRSCYLS